MCHSEAFVNSRRNTPGTKKRILAQLRSYTREKTRLYSTDKTSLKVETSAEGAVGQQ